MMGKGNRSWLAAGAVTVGLAVAVASCGGSGGGGGRKGNPSDQFFLSNASNRGNLVVNVNPVEVDANKSDRIGVVATLTDSLGGPLPGVTIVFTADIDDIRFIGSNPFAEDGPNDSIGIATTDGNGNADIIAVAGSTPTSTGAILGTGMIFAQAPPAFFLAAGVSVTLTDVGFIDSDVLTVIPSEVSLIEPSIGSVVFFNVVGGTPPYILKNEFSGVGFATLSNHCAPGCTENAGTLCIGSPCLSDEDCNEAASPLPADVCIGAIRRCLASCQGTNCGGSRCDTDADCNDGSPTPANVCKDSGQSVVYTVLSDAISDGDPASPEDTFIVEDSAGGAVLVSIDISFFCGNGVARGNEQCDLGSINPATCDSFGLAEGCTAGDVGLAFCDAQGVPGPLEIMNNCTDCQLELECSTAEPMPTPAP
jgi:hypothetical protein